MASRRTSAWAFGVAGKPLRTVKIFVRLRESCYLKADHQPALCVKQFGAMKLRWLREALSGADYYVKFDGTPRPKEPAQLAILSVVDAYACSYHQTMQTQKGITDARCSLAA